MSFNKTQLGLALALICAGNAYAQVCGFTVTPSQPSVDANAQKVTFQVQASVPTCTWASAASDFAAVLSPASGTGTGSVVAQVAGNSTGSPRTTSLTVAGQSITLTQTAAAAGFTDVAPTDYFASAATLLQQRGVPIGCSTAPLQLCPSDVVTRRQFAAMLVATLYGSTFSSTAVPWFDDVLATDTQFAAIQKMKDLGLTAGCGVRLFCPDDPMTRPMAAVFLTRARMGGDAFTAAPVAIFADVPPTDPYFKWVQQLWTLGFTGGCTVSPRTFCSSRTITRAEAAVFLARSGFNLALNGNLPVISSAVTYSAGTFVLGGTNTNFAQGTTRVVFSDAGYTPGTATTSSPTQLSVNVAQPGTAPKDAISISAVTGTETAVLPNAYRPGSATPQNSAQINNFAFLQSTINVVPGTQVTWTNLQAAGHTVTSDNGSFTSSTIGNTGTFAAQFLTPGTYTYHCSIHPFMTGTVVVK
jgi:plastocyanin